MYMVTAGVVALTSVMYGAVVRRMALKQVVILTLILLGISSALVPTLMNEFSGSLAVFAGVYLLAQVRGSLGTIQFATLFNEQFTHRPERFVGLVGAGATLAGIVVGLSIGFVSKMIEVEMLMYAAAIIDLMTIVPVILLPRQSERIFDDPEMEQQNVERPRLFDALRSSFVLGIAGVVLLSVLVATVVEYQWKVTAATELLRDEELMAQYFGFFYGAVYLLTGILQFVVTGHVLQRRGVLVGLLVFPVALMISMVTAVVFSIGRLPLWTMTMTKGCDMFRRSMHDPSIQVLYSPLDVGLRRQSITMVAGIVKPLAEAMAGVLLVVLSPWIAVFQFSWLVVALVVAWLIIDFSVFRGYIRLKSGD